MYKRHNDYELIYRIIKNHDEEAFSIMVTKYQKLIYKNVHSLCYEKRDFEDFYQEGLIMLEKAIRNFDESKNKTFMRYFELILRRRYIDLNRKQNRYVLQETMDYMLQYSSHDIEFEKEEIDKKFDEPLDYIYDAYFLKGIKITEITKKLGWERKKVYNSIYKIRKSLKDML